MKKLSQVKIEEYVQEAALISGFLMLAKGLYLFFPPAMWTVCGILLILFGIPFRNIKNSRKEGK